MTKLRTVSAHPTPLKHVEKDHLHADSPLQINSAPNLSAAFIKKTVAHLNVERKLRKLTGWLSVAIGTLVFG
jgi:hypothetical protein